MKRVHRSVRPLDLCWGLLALMAIALIVFAVVALSDGFRRQHACEASGGVYTRSGCFDPSVIRIIK